MANKALKDTRFVMPDAVKKNLLAAYNEFKDKGINGGERATFLLKSKSVSYGEMKRLKNYFDTTDVDENNPQFKLNGGIEMKNWVNQALGQARSGVYNPKKVQHDIGIENKFLKTHTKDGNANPTGISMPKIAMKTKDIFNNANIYKEEIAAQTAIILIKEELKNIFLCQQN